MNTQLLLPPAVEKPATSRTSTSPQRFRQGQWILQVPCPAIPVETRPDVRSSPRWSAHGTRHLYPLACLLLQIIFTPLAPTWVTSIDFRLAP